MRSTTRIPCSSRAVIFSGIVRDEAHSVHAEQLKGLGRNFEDAAIRFVTQFKVRLHRIEAHVLQLVSAQLSHQADTAAFLLLVHQDAGALIDDALHCEFELLTAVATEGTKDVSCEALRMNADDGRRRVDVAEHERDASFDAARGRGSPGRQGSGSVMTPSKPWMRKCPQREGKSASAILLTAMEAIRRL